MEDERLQAQAAAFCKQRLVERILPLTALERGTADILRFDGQVLCLYDNLSRTHMLAWAQEDAARAWLRRMQPPGCLVMESSALDAAAAAALQLPHGVVMLNVLYDHEEPLPVLLPMELKPLGPSDVPLAARCYSILPQDALEKAAGEGRLLGGWLDGVMTGFIGIHEEGCMGMLHVFEPHRRRGCAQAIESLLINRLLRQGLRPSGQILLDNEPSMALHRKLGFRFAAYPGSWRFRDD